MYEYDVPDMNCSHCVAAVTRAIRAADPDASAEIDLPQHKATVATRLDPASIAAALDDAGYPSTFRIV